MQNKGSIIRWTDITSNTFMYGSHLKLYDNAVVFENVLMPSGEIIHQWKMMTYYPSDKRIPRLPLLKNGQTYCFQFDYDVFPVGSVYFKVIFKRRNGEEVDVVMVEDKVVTITYPTDAFSYEIQLINAAANSLTFRSIRIMKSTQQLETEQSLYLSEMIQTDDEADTLNIVLVASEGLIKDTIKKLRNVILVNDWNSDDFNKIVDCLQPLQQDYSLNFIGYTKAGSHMAYALAAYMTETAWVTHDDSLHKEAGMTLEVFGNKLLPDHTLSLVSSLLHPSRYLNALDVDRLNGGDSLCSKR
ncbi:accessory Sec system protein Asp3 [Staphylococcus americanisciuri]|uniref:Accessory Sec system protein Asp3 n=1 Tax=Staphylococcus americanisciuri TaxID=2973940 RepID=A0ABT2F4N0_9STAP|nr:accessory Sec system protein Asp3 [Staphylococcus americanisciuri]MCS4487340.1 accessory Sec system protein Asp3 [Staphylococcus americanisciuri]